MSEHEVMIFADTLGQSPEKTYVLNLACGRGQAFFEADASAEDFLNSLLESSQKLSKKAEAAAEAAAETNRLEGLKLKQSLDLLQSRGAALLETESRFRPGGEESLKAAVQQMTNRAIQTRRGLQDYLVQSYFWPPSASLQVHDSAVLCDTCKEALGIAKTEVLPPGPSTEN